MACFRPLLFLSSGCINPHKFCKHLPVKWFKAFLCSTSHWLASRDFFLSSSSISFPFQLSEPDLFYVRFSNLICSIYLFLTLHPFTKIDTGKIMRIVCLRIHSLSSKKHINLQACLELWTLFISINWEQGSHVKQVLTSQDGRALVIHLQREMVD